MVKMGVVRNRPEFPDALFRIFPNHIARKWCIVNGACCFSTRAVFFLCLQLLRCCAAGMELSVKLALPSRVSCCCFADGGIFVGTKAGGVYEIELDMRYMVHRVRHIDDGNAIVDGIAVHTPPNSRQHIATGAPLDTQLILRVEGAIKWKHSYALSQRAMKVIELCGDRYILTDCTQGGFLVWSCDNGNMLRHVTHTPGTYISHITPVYNPSPHSTNMPAVWVMSFSGDIVIFQRGSFDKFEHLTKPWDPYASKYNARAHVVLSDNTLYVATGEFKTESNMHVPTLCRFGAPNGAAVGTYRINVNGPLQWDEIAPDIWSHT